MILPTRQVISGTGKPRFIKEMELKEVYKTGTASQSGTTITGVGTQWIAAMKNGIIKFANGTQRNISNVGGVTSLTVLQSGTITSQSYVLTYYGNDYYQTTGTTTYSTTTVVDTVALPSSIKVGMRIRALKTNAGFAGTLSYAKILSIDAGTKTLTIDEWIGGTPTNGEKYVIDGWIADLPRCEELKEIFEPDNLIHPLYKSRLKVKSFGWKYSAKLNYSTFLSPDVAFDMKEIVTFAISGSNENVQFIPRKEKYGIVYDVFFSDALEAILHQTQKGHKGVVFGLQGKSNVATPPFFSFGGYGTGYGQLYGTQL